MNEPQLIVDQNGNEFSGSLLGMNIKGKGPVVILLLALMAATALIVMGLEQQNVLLKDQMANHARDLNRHDEAMSLSHAMQSKQHDELIGALESQLYIMCQGNPECRKFDLQMPRILRSMQRR